MRDEKINYVRYVIIMAWGNLYSHRNRKFYVRLVDAAIWESKLPTEKIQVDEYDVDKNVNHVKWLLILNVNFLLS